MLWAPCVSSFLYGHAQEKACRQRQEQTDAPAEPGRPMEMRGGEAVDGVFHCQGRQGAEHHAGDGSRGVEAIVGRQKADALHDAAGTMIGGGGEEEREADGEAAEVEAHGETAVPLSGNAHELQHRHCASADRDVSGHVGGAEAEVGDGGGS